MVDEQAKAIRIEFAKELLHIIEAGGDAYSRLANIKKVLEAECQKVTELLIAK